VRERGDDGQQLPAAVPAAPADPSSFSAWRLQCRPPHRAVHDGGEHEDPNATRPVALQLGEQQGVSLLQQTLDEEAQADTKLTRLAEQVINLEAER
jgi:hypothetical protein